jgi:tRNA(Arg) A34 adenosine deaminase TadA
MFTKDDHNFMRLAMEEARLASERDEVPIGAVVVNPETNEVIARNGNRTIELSDPTAHAEILCIREACEKEQNQRIPKFDLYVTLEPCTMCAGAIANARLRRLIIGALDEKGGGVLHGAKFFDQSTCHHKIDIQTGLMAEESAILLKSYFKKKR